MLVYPQLTHFPIVKRRRLRTVINRAADGRTVRLADPAAEITEWQLQYADLSDEEASALEQFFVAAEGTLNGFTFVDPTANLLAWSGKLDEAVWLKAPMLTVGGGPVEWRLENGGDGPQTISQSIGAPAGFVYCFSVYARADAAASVKMLAGNRSAEYGLTSEWRRIRLTATVDTANFGLEVAAGGSVEARMPQVEAQAGASVERTTTTGGVYDNARLRDDTLEIVATGINRHSCTVNIVHANHI